jgi:hypothetical protein
MQNRQITVDGLDNVGSDHGPEGMPARGKTADGPLPRVAGRQQLGESDHGEAAQPESLAAHVEAAVGHLQLHGRPFDAILNGFDD